MSASTTYTGTMDDPRLAELAARLDSLTSNPLLYPSSDPAPYFDLIAPLIRGTLESVAHRVPPDVWRPTPPELIDQFHTPPPENSSPSIQAVIERAISSHTVGPMPCNPMNFAYAPSHNGLESIVGSVIAQAWQAYAGIRTYGPGALAVEEGLIQWMCGLFDLPSTAHGMLLTGGAMAQLHATVYAREHGRAKGAKLETMRVYLSEDAHNVGNRAAHVVGLPREALRVIDVDDRGKMDMDDLERKIQEDVNRGIVPTMLIVTAGTTGRGAVDDLARAATIAKKYDMWYHLDACYGGFFKLLPELQDLFAGADQADSIAVDPHKTLFAPWGSGALLLRDIAKAERYLTKQDVVYIQRDNQGSVLPDFCDYNIELSREPRGLKLWVPLQLYGVGAYREALASRLQLAEYLERRLDQIPGMRRLPTQLAVVLVHLERDPDRNARWVNGMLARLEVMLSSALVNGILCVRLTTSQIRARVCDIDRLVSIMQEVERGLDQ